MIPEEDRPILLSDPHLYSVYCKRWKQRVCGVYYIRCLANGRFYVGSSVNMQTRWVGHRSALRKREHQNTHLQRAFDKYGDSQFAVGVLEFTLTDLDAQKQEQAYLDHVVAENPGRYFNIATSVEGHDNAERMKTVQLISPSGETVTVTGFGRFCREHGLDPGSLAKVLKNPAWQHKGWKSVHYQNPRDEPMKFIDSTGQTIETNRKDLREFCAARGLQHGMMLSLWRRERACSGGWTRYDNPSCNVVVSPTGERHVIGPNQTSGFMREHNLGTRFFHLLRGLCNEYRGWIVEKAPNA